MVNQRANISGYSAVQRILGYMPQLPKHPALVLEGPVEAVRRSVQIRAVAMEAWAKVSSRQRLLTSMRSGEVLEVVGQKLGMVQQQWSPSRQQGLMRACEVPCGK
eukprot:5851786-Amphidinium_carterae.2